MGACGCVWVRVGACACVCVCVCVGACAFRKGRRQQLPAQSQSYSIFFFEINGALLLGFYRFAVFKDTRKKNMFSFEIYSAFLLGF